jgi:hypothetical protein
MCEIAVGKQRERVEWLAVEIGESGTCAPESQAHARNRAKGTGRIEDQHCRIWLAGTTDGYGTDETRNDDVPRGADLGAGARRREVFYSAAWPDLFQNAVFDEESAIRNDRKFVDGGASADPRKVTS